MLTCSAANASVAAGRFTLVGAAHLKNYFQSSSLLLKYHLLNLRNCVLKLPTQPISSFPSLPNSCPSFVEARQDRRGVPPTHLQKPVGRRKMNTNHCCLLNLNHHISFHYINSSIVTLNAVHRRCFHQSIAVVAGVNARESETSSNGSINHNLLKDSMESKPELFMSDKLEVKEEAVCDEENEEDLKEHVWSTGPAVLPTFNVGAYANESENAKRLVQLGVNLSQWEGRYGTIPILYKSNFDKQIQPIISFLNYIGVEGTKLAHILSVNPFIFNEDVRNLKKRVEYLRLKNFSDEAIIDIIAGNPYWLSFSVPRIDRRLGFFQTYFKLTGDQVRKLASAGSSGPKLITYNLGRVKDVTFTIKEEMGFTSKEIVKLLLARPRIWKEVPESLRRRFDYLHNEEKFPHADFIRWPMLLLQRERRMKERIGFLKKLGRAQFDPSQPNYISVEMLCSGNDAEFAADVAKVGVLEYNNYLKTL